MTVTVSSSTVSRNYCPTPHSMGLRAQLRGQLVAPVVPDEAFTQPRLPLSHVDKAFGRNLRRLG
jgi:hypothetical protein